MDAAQAQDAAKDADDIVVAVEAIATSRLTALDADIRLWAVRLRDLILLRNQAATALGIPAMYCSLEIGSKEAVEAVAESLKRKRGPSQSTITSGKGLAAWIAEVGSVRFTDAMKHTGYKVSQTNRLLNKWGWFEQDDDNHYRLTALGRRELLECEVRT